MAGPTVAVAITKTQLWHGKQEQFDTVYYYDGPSFQAGDENYRRLAEGLADEEKKVFGANVTFDMARVWSAGGTIIENVTKGLYDLNGVGQAAGQTVHGEGAVLIQIECERPNVLGRKVYLRKYLRVGQIFGANQAAMAEGRQALDPSFLTIYRNYANAIKARGTVGTPEFNLVSPTGRVPKAGVPPLVGAYIISREYRRN